MIGWYHLPSAILAAMVKLVRVSNKESAARYGAFLCSIGGINNNAYCDSCVRLRSSCGA